MAYHSEDDLLSALLRHLELSAEIIAHGHYCGRWALDTSGSGRAAFHLLGEGRARVELRERAPLALGPGDFVLFPRDLWHRVVPEEAADPGATTEVLCGYFRFALRMDNPIASALPEIVHIPASTGGDYPQIASLVRLLLNEAGQASPGRQLFLDRLSDGLFVLVLRQVLASGGIGRSVLAALAEPRLAKALAALHADLARDWTVAALARSAGMSRTAFSLAFSAATGIAPMRYLIHQRLETARQLLQERGRSVAQVAEAVGYADESAFRRAFQRQFGIGPGALRRGKTGSAQ